MTMIRMSVATVTASLAAEISLCAVIVYNHRLGRRKWRYNRSVKPAPGLLASDPFSLPCCMGTVDAETDVPLLKTPSREAVRVTEL